MNQEKTVEIIAKRLEGISNYYDARQLPLSKSEIVEVLSKNLPGYSRQEIEKVIDTSFSSLRYRISWEKFLRYLTLLLDPRWMASSKTVSAATTMESCAG